VIPVGPVEEEPVGPVAPVIPVGPVKEEPVGPVAPVIPVGPVGPSCVYITCCMVATTLEVDGTEVAG